MTIEDRVRRDQLFMRLEDGGWLFEHFHICRQPDGMPVVLGSGRFARVYEMEYDQRQDVHYAVRVTGFDLSEESPNKERAAVMSQQTLCGASPYIVRVMETRELLVTLDQNYEISSIQNVKDRPIEPGETGLYLMVVLMERLEPLIVIDRFHRTSLTRPELATPEGALVLALQIGQALCLMHDRYMLHRDIKLENIFWSERDQCYQLGDFGCARETVDGTAQTVIYTDGYGAPEIRRSLQAKYDAAADIYSFGITLYLLLNNLRFPGSTGYRCNEHLQYSEGSPYPEPVNATEELSRIIRTMCSYSVEDRYHSMGTVLSALANCAREDETVSHDVAEAADVATETYHASREWQRIEGAQPKTREQWLEERRYWEMRYRKSSAWYAALLLPLFSALYYVTQTTSVYGEARWTFWLLPVLVILQSFLQRIHDLEWTVGTIIALYGIVYFIDNGLNTPYILMMGAVFLGVPLITWTSAGGTFLWLALTEGSGRGLLYGILRFLEAHDLGWILLLLILTLVYKAAEIRWLSDKMDDDRSLLMICVMFPLLAICGILILLLHFTTGAVIPDAIRSLHLVRVSLLAKIIWCWLAGVSLLDLLTSDEDSDHNDIGNVAALYEDDDPYHAATFYEENGPGNAAATYGDSYGNCGDDYDDATNYRTFV